MHANTQYLGTVTSSGAMGDASIGNSDSLEPRQATAHSDITSRISPEDKLNESLEPDTCGINNVGREW